MHATKNPKHSGAHSMTLVLGRHAPGGRLGRAPQRGGREACAPQPPRHHLPVPGETSACAYVILPCKQCRKSWHGAARGCTSGRASVGHTDLSSVVQMTCRRVSSAPHMGNLSVVLAMFVAVPVSHRRIASAVGPARDHRSARRPARGQRLPHHQPQLHSAGWDDCHHR